MLENVGTNAVVGILTASDPDAGDSVTFTLPVGVDDNSAFNISGDLLRANGSFDFENISSYTVTVRVTDALGLSFDKQFTISVTDVAEVTYSVAAGLLTVTGTGLKDDITVLNDAGTIKVSANGTMLNPGIAAAVLTTVSVSGLGGNDTLRIDSSLGTGVLGTLFGGEGNDVLLGGDGNDTLDGGAGNDTYVFNTNTPLGSDTVTDSAGSDYLYFAGSTNNVTVNLGLTTSQVVNANLTLTLASATCIEHIYGGSGNDTLTGNTLNNTLNGGSGADVLDGGDGIDTLFGGAGNDTLVGGAGNDTYAFNTNTPLGSDTVTDSAGNDYLYFVGSTNNVTVNLGLMTSQVINANLTLTPGLGHINRTYLWRVGERHANRQQSEQHAEWI